MPAALWPRRSRPRSSRGSRSGSPRSTPPRRFAAMRLFRRRGLDPETSETFQPKLWLVVIGLVLIGVYIVAFIAENNKRVSVHFVLFKTHTSVIWLILLSVGIGLLVGLLASQLTRRRGRKQRGQP